MSALDDIKARAEVNQYLGQTASQDEAKATLKLIAALEAVEARIAAHEARTPFPDADKIDKAYSLGKHHGYEAVRAAINEALEGAA